MSSIISLSHNIFWESTDEPLFTIITPIYNRRHTLYRTIKSVENQVFRDFEYILVDDGSQQACDDIIADFFDRTTIPVLYIKKTNGGVHTARNIAYREARGKLIIGIDSDDELVPDACKIFANAWNMIPQQYKSSCWQIKGLCSKVDGSICSALFPQDINSMPIEEAKKYFSLANGEQFGCRVASILKENLFPEPEGVTFVNECVVWVSLESKYRSWGINDVVRIYHTEGDDRICSEKKKSQQSCINAMWNSCYELNNMAVYSMNIKTYLFTMLRFDVMKCILFMNGKTIYKKIRLNSIKNRVMSWIMMLPSAIVAFVYQKKRM